MAILVNAAPYIVTGSATREFLTFVAVIVVVFALLSLLVLMMISAPGYTTSGSVWLVEEGASRRAQHVSLFVTLATEA